MRSGISEKQKDSVFRDQRNEVFQSAESKVNRLKSFFKTIKHGRALERCEEQFNFKIGTEGREVQAYHATRGEVVVKNEAGNNQGIRFTDIKRDFSHESKAPLRGKALKTWAVVYGSSERREAEGFTQELIQANKKDYYFKMEEPIYWEFEGNSRNFKSWNTAIDQLLEEYAEHRKTLIIVCVSPQNGRQSPVYTDVKRKCLVEGLPCQFVLKKSTFGKSVRNIAKNVLIQMQAKMSGSPWGLGKLPALKVPTMVVGIDACHNVGKQKQSVLCMSASTDQHISKYFNKTVTVDRPRDVRPKELEIPFSDPLIEAIEAFKKTNKVYPKQLVVFRDSTSDGQRDNMREKDVRQIRKALIELGLGDMKFIFMTMNKNVEQRFWENTRKGILNPRHGLFIDDP